MQAATVNRESQKMLAKLLAKENINVRVGNYSTAFFDVERRVLGLPMWNADNKQVSDLLVGHEVGHALYTPADAIARFHEALPGVPFDIGNIVEDVRIERLIQNNYPGLVYSFKEGYRHFIEKDFFKINGTDLSTLGFADRLNIRAKIGTQLQVPMNDLEEAVYARCRAAETYDEVLDICKTVYEMVSIEKREEEEEEEAETKTPDTPDENSPTTPRGKESKQKSDDAGKGENGTDGDQSDSDNEKDGGTETYRDSKDDGGKTSDKADSTSDKKGKSDERKANSKKKDRNAEADKDGEGESVPDNMPGYGNAQDELTSKTMQSFGEQLHDMQETVTDYLVGNAPNAAEMMKCVIPVEEIMAERHRCTSYVALMSAAGVQEDWKDFKSATKKHISVLVKEFERRKAAFQYSRAQQSTTGTIDVNRLHAYKFEDQIFCSITKLADAKNHGMVFFIDYSGSMSNTIGRVIVQTLQLVYFCKAVGIPFEVYGFTSPVNYKHETDPNLKFGSNIAFRYTHIFELVNSTMKRDKFELACKELKAQAYLHADSHGGNGSMPFSNNKYEVMNGTPLNETIVVAHEIVKRFKARHHVQKMNTIFLTDGDACQAHFDYNNADETYRKASTVPEWKCGNMIPVNGRNIMFRSYDKGLYAALIENLRITCGTTVIGFFVANYRSDYKSTAITALRYTAKKDGEILPWRSANELFQKKSREARKEKCMMILGGYNYDAYFVFDSKNGLDINDDDEEFVSSVVSESFSDASSQNRLAKQFTKFTSEKKLSRVFLNKFAEIIA
jgi:hypothetical protein